MKTLIIYYSRTNNTRIVAESLAQFLQARLHEIKTKGYSGIFGYFRAGRHAMKQKLCKLPHIEEDLESYDLVIIGTPVWAWNLSVPIRTFLVHNSERLDKVAFFCTRGGSDPEKIFNQMKEICGKEPLATFAPTAKEVSLGTYQDQEREFIRTIQSVK